MHMLAHMLQLVPVGENIVVQMSHAAFEGNKEKPAAVLLRACAHPKYFVLALMLQSLKIVRTSAFWRSSGPYSLHRHQCRSSASNYYV